MNKTRYDFNFMINLILYREVGYSKKTNNAKIN